MINQNRKLNPGSQSGQAQERIKKYKLTKIELKLPDNGNKRCSTTESTKNSDFVITDSYTKGEPMVDDSSEERYSENEHHQ